MSNEYLQSMVKHEPDDQVKAILEDALTRQAASNADKLVYHLSYADSYHEAILDVAPTNAYNMRYVHARQYHATMAAAYAALINAEILKEFPETTKRLSREWGIDEFRELIRRGTETTKADGRNNPSNEEVGD